MRPRAAVLLALALLGCAPSGAQGPPEPVEIVGRLPHEAASFTQGLEFVAPDLLVESSGLKGQSQIRMYRAETGRSVASAELPDDVFGEGVTRVGERFIQLTWRSETAYVWALSDLRPLGTLNYEGQGWGLCYDGEVVWRSDGSATLRAHDPQDFTVLASVDVTRQGHEVSAVNELECVNGAILSNVWHSQEVLLIDPETGQVEEVYDLSGVHARAESDCGCQLDGEKVLNGIAYDHASQLFVVSGKQWPYSYQVRLGSP